MGDALIFALAVIFCFALIPVSAWLGSALGLVDTPGQDALKIHVKPIAVSGGLAVFVSLMVALAVGGSLPRIAALTGVAIALAIGALDDIRSLGALPRTVLLALAGTLLAVGGARVWTPGILGAIGVALLLVGCANAVNLMDGQDGLVAGLGAVAALGLAVVLARYHRSGQVDLPLALCGSLLGFLAWNRPPARIFLGNGGAYGLGAALALATATVSTVDGVRGLLVSFICLSVFAFEIRSTVARRAAAGAPITGGDRQHSYDLVAQRIGSRPVSTVLYWILGGLAAGASILCSLAPIAAGAALSALIAGAASSMGIRHGYRLRHAEVNHGSTSGSDSRGV